MKYRVKKIEWEKENFYYPQRKKYLFWKYYYKNNFERQGNQIVCHSREESWEYIENHKDWPIITYEYN